MKEQNASLLTKYNTVLQPQQIEIRLLGNIEDYLQI